MGIRELVNLLQSKKAMPALDFQVDRAISTNIGAHNI
jgi:hypothetical protein